MGLFDRFKKTGTTKTAGQGPFAGLTEVQAELLVERLPDYIEVDVSF